MVVSGAGRVPTRRAAMMGGLGAAAAFVLAACGSSGTGTGGGAAGPGSGDRPSLTLGLTYVPNVQFAPYYLALQRGYFSDAGVDVELRHHGESEDIFGALAAGQEDVVVAGGDEVLQARSQGTDVVSVATTYQRSPVVLVVPQDSPITVPQDLTGTTIGIPGRFGQSWFGLLEILEQAGLSEDDVTISEIGYTQQQALAGGHVDSVVGFVNNDVAQFRATGLDVRAVEPVEPLPIVSVGIATSDALLASDPDAVRAVVEAVGRATADIVADPSLAVDASLEEIPGTVPDDQRQTMLEVTQATAPLYGDLEDPFGEQDPDLWDAMATAMSELGLVDGATTADGAWTDAAVSSD